MVHKEKVARQLATRLASIARPPDCPLFEHYLVFGQSNVVLASAKPSLIYQWPLEKPLPIQALEQFVFPTGMPADRDMSRIASSVLDYHEKHPQNSFALLLTTSIKEVFYAICVVDEYLKPWPTFIPPTDLPTTSKLAWSTRCHCLITRYPLFDLMFDVLLHILDVEEKSLTLPPAHRSGELNQITRILQHLWSIRPPLPGATISLGIPRIPSYKRPLRYEDETLITQHCVPTLFWALDKDSILGLVAAALLECKLLFVSPNLRILSNCILSFVALLKPFVLQCVFIPILPDDLLDIAEAPVPFIAGLANPKLIKAAREANPELIIVDLTARKIHCPDDVVVPPIPNSKNLSHAIDQYVVPLKKSFDKYLPPYKATKTQKDLVTELLRLLEQYITPYFEAFRRHCVTSLTDNVTVFLKETWLLEETDPVSLEFFQPFLETQIFSHWCDQKLTEIDQQRQARQPSSVKLTTSTPKPQPTNSLGVSGQLPRPSSSDDLAALANSAPLDLSEHFEAATRNRSYSVASSSSNDAFVASLQFDFASLDSPHSVSSTPAAVPLTGGTPLANGKPHERPKRSGSESFVKSSSKNSLSTITEDGESSPSLKSSKK